MKKLLSVLGAITLITTASASTTAIVNTESNTNIYATPYATENWKVNAEGPRTTLEKIGGVWRLEFNHELTQDIISGSAKTSDILDFITKAVDIIPGLKDKIGSIPEIIDVILNFGKGKFEKTDKGNGVLIRFGGWVLPTKITESTNDWNL